MGWKMRKDKLQSDQADDEAMQDDAFQVNDDDTEVEADASAMARLAQLSADTEPAPFVLDLDQDSFRTDTKRTSLDPSEFGWMNGGQSNGQERPKAQAAAPAPTAPPLTPPPANAIPAFEAPPFTPAPPPAYNRADYQGPSFDPISLSQPAAADPFPTPTTDDIQWSGPRPGAPQAASTPSWAQPAPAAAPPPAFADPSAGFSGGPAFADSAPSPSFATPPSAPQEEPAWARPQPVAEPPSAFAPPSTPASNPFSQESLQSGAGQYAPSSAASPYASQPLRPTSDGQNINSFSRDSVAAGLVTGDGELSIPKVAPFIVAGGMQQEEVVTTSGDHYLILRIRNLSSSYKLTKDITTIGRPDSITKNYPDVEIDLDDGVSRKHAEIRKKGSDFFVVDVGSTNGTLLNGQLMDVNIENRLTHGDRIRVGEKTEIVFE